MMRLSFTRLRCYFRTWSARLRFPHAWIQRTGHCHHKLPEVRRRDCSAFWWLVAKYMGNGVLVYFGYPQAHEDDAERAVRTGLELMAVVSEFTTHAPLQTRVGIATGLVVVGDLVGSGEAQVRGIVGETPNLASRAAAGSRRAQYDRCRREHTETMVRRRRPRRVLLVAVVGRMGCGTCRRFGPRPRTRGTRLAADRGRAGLVCSRPRWYFGTVILTGWSRILADFQPIYITPVDGFAR
jgi:hypothetical protein